MDVVCDPCRSELARDKPENVAGCQVSRVIVHDHREQARSYRVCVEADYLKFTLE
ncbi:hypothetical protein D3C81_2195990 [compost metagenome]